MIMKWLTESALNFMGQVVFLMVFGLALIAFIAFTHMMIMRAIE